MGNKMCCEAKGIEQGNINIIDNSINNVRIQQFLHANKTIKTLLQNNYLADKNLLKQRDKFLTASQEYVFDDGIFIGNNIQRDNMRKGYGIMLYHDHSYYEGGWEDDMRSGIGFYASEEGQYYNGEWSQDLAWGKGEFKSLHPHLEYDGDWVSGNKEGFGKQKYQDGSKYTGQFFNGLKQGFGKIVYSDSTYYEGQFKDNFIDGQGTFHGKNNRYQGSWKNGRMHGAGKSEWFDDSGKLQARYVGQYHYGIKQGFGQYTDSKGMIYKANWVNGEMNERGPIITEKQT